VTFFEAVVLGLVEGITEYLPVSSTGHLILAAWLLGLDDPSRRDAVDAFVVVVQGGAILAVLGLYQARVRRMASGIAGRDEAGRRLAVRLLVAFLPAAVLGFLLDDLLERLLFHAGPVLFALVAGGVVMIALDRRAAPPGAMTALEDLTLRQALFVGLLQCFALWPGTSRSMTTIVGGTLVGLPPAAAAEFSFLLAVPTLGAACLYRLGTDHASIATLGLGSVLVGIAVATGSAALAVRWLVGFLGRRGLAPFGWYRIAIAVVLLALVATGVLSVE
jgi:undecaprenyl-diphosphatase